MIMHVLRTSVLPARALRFLTASMAAAVVSTGLSVVPAGAASHKVVTVVAGVEHTCALMRSGAVRCMGSGDHGQLGVPHTPNSDTPVSVPGVTGATALAAGLKHTCAVLTSTKVVCWGANDSGQVGVNPAGGHAIVATPTTVSGLTRATALTAGRTHTCALLVTGTVKCWGGNREGELGDASTTSSPTPVKVKGINDVVEIHATFFGTCALRTDATVWCWGATGLPTTSLIPTKAPIKGVVHLSSGAGFNCAIVRSGAVKCWGSAGLGVLGDGGATASFATTPVTVTGLTKAIALSSGEAHSCAILEDHTTWCWGYNDSCELGTDLNNCTTSNIPLEVVGGHDFSKISLGVEDSCAVLRTTATAMCWGMNYFNQLGDRNIVGPSPAFPVAVGF